MTYLDFLKKITPFAEEEFSRFQKRLIFTKREILGIRTPKLREIAKSLKGKMEEILSFPDIYYETVFIQLTLISMLPYEEFLSYLPRAVALIDNWALCDCFKAKCIQKRRREFLPHLEELFQTGQTYFVRYVLVTLLGEYVDDKFLPVVLAYIRRTTTEEYYIHTAVAWLVAEILIKAYENGVALLKEGVLDRKTHNKAIQKAIESYRITNERKEFLRSLKMKK